MDEHYLIRVLKGDTEAFSYFVSTYKNMAYSIALSVLKDEFLAEEAVQNAFINAFRNLDGFERQSRFSTWFYRIVTNESLMLLRKLKRLPITLESSHANGLPDNSTVLSLEQAELKHLVNEGLKQLPPDESLALRLFYLEEESIKEVCEITGWSNSNAKVILHRARKHLSIILNRLYHE